MRCSLMRRVHVCGALPVLRSLACRMADQSLMVRIRHSQGGRRDVR